MKKYFFVLILAIVIPKSFAQSIKSVSPNWKKGDKKYVTLKKQSETWVSDTLLFDMDVSSAYNLEVLDDEDNYTLMYSQQQIEDYDMEMSGDNQLVDTLMGSFMSILDRIAGAMTSVETKVKVYKTSGQAYRVENMDEVMDQSLVVVKDVLNELNPEADYSSKFDSMMNMIKMFMAMSGDKSSQTILNNINIIFQAYKYQYDPAGETTEEVLVSDPNMFSEWSNVNFPALLKVRATPMSQNRLKLEVDQVFDREFLINKIQEKYEDKADLQLPDLTLESKETVIFDLSTGWIVTHHSSDRFEFPGYKSLNTQSLTFESR